MLKLYLCHLLHLLSRRLLTLLRSPTTRRRSPIRSPRVWCMLFLLLTLTNGSAAYVNLINTLSMFAQSGATLTLPKGWGTSKLRDCAQTVYLVATLPLPASPLTGAESAVKCIILAFTRYQPQLQSTTHPLCPLSCQTRL